jgi:peptidoglycan/LPS O-acetylase OafA/YrhL
VLLQEDLILISLHKNAKLIDGRRMEIAEYAIFFASTKLTWSLSIAWAIFACHYGYGGPLNSFLSIKAFLPLTRLTYCAYLIHPAIMQYFNYSQQALFHATFLTLIYIAIGHIIVTLVLAFVFTLLFEMPFLAVEKLVYPGRH